MNVRLLFMIFFVVFSFAFTSAAVSQTITLGTYSFVNDTSEYHEITYSDVKIIVPTTLDATCKYSDVSGSMSYASMDGLFDLSSGLKHEKSFTDLGDGVYTFYVKCTTSSLNGSEPAAKSLTLRVNSLVTAKIILDEDAPLSSGRVGVTLLTSKVVSQPPTLTYSFDGLVYNDIPLFGSGTVFQGYLIVPKSLNDAVVSFKFRANDLEGREGNQFTSESVFVVDTAKPGTISDIIATGNVGDIFLEWHFTENDHIEEYAVYRSTSPNVAHTDYYTTTDDTDYRDTSVTKGKTYYYRVAAIDEAGNEGDLSREVVATVLSANVTSEKTGLAPYLLGKVENFLVDVGSVVADIERLQVSWEEKSDVERDLYENIGLKDALSSALSEANALGREIESLRLQDLSETELDKRLSAATVKLNVIRRKIPESLTITEQSSFLQEAFSEGDVRAALLAVNASISERYLEQSVDTTLKFIETSGFKVERNQYVLEVVYLEGTVKEMTVVQKKILGEIERQGGTFFVEYIPSDFSSSASKINFIQGPGTTDEGEGYFSFPSDMKVLLYAVDESVALSSAEATSTLLVKFASVEEKGNSITGYVVSVFEGSEYSGVVFGLVLIAGLAGYFFFVRRKGGVSSEEMHFTSKIESLRKAFTGKDFETARMHYGDIKRAYVNLSPKLKKKFHGDLLSFYDQLKRRDSHES